MVLINRNNESFNYTHGYEMTLIYHHNEEYNYTLDYDMNLIGRRNEDSRLIFLIESHFIIKECFFI